MIKIIFLINDNILEQHVSRNSLFGHAHQVSIKIIVLFFFAERKRSTSKRKELRTVEVSLQHIYHRSQNIPVSGSSWCACGSRKVLYGEMRTCAAGCSILGTVAPCYQDITTKPSIVTSVQRLQVAGGEEL